MNLKNKALVGVASAALISSIGMWEGTKYTPYEDVIGVLTVCKGHTGHDVIQGRVYTPEECNKLLERDLKAFREGVDKCTNVPLTPNQFDAFTMFSYNVGINNFCKANFTKLLNQGKYTEACNGIATSPSGQPVWSYADGKYVQGLQNRRQYERKMCLGQL